MTQADPIDFSDAPEWYDKNAEAFSAASRAVDTQVLMNRFIVGMPAGARILDLGCGAGRDARAFLDHGFTVEAIDASAKMCAQTRDFTQGRAAVRQARIEDLPREGETWDGIWMMASLLHVPRAAWADTLARLVGALAPGGRLYLSVKDGAGEEIDARGRPMAHSDADELEELLSRIAPSSASVEVWKTHSAASGGEMQTWLNGLMRLG